MNSTSTSDVPSKLGRYELVRKIATGGMATVHLGRISSKGAFERSVAVKVLHPELARDPGFVAMFLDEARLAAQIRHPNVVDVYDVDAENGWLYLVMQYIEGTSVADLVAHAEKRKIPIPLGVALKIVVDALAGLHAAHELKSADGVPLDLIHRDVSPANLLVGKDGTTRVTDFGVAKSTGRLANTGTRNVVKGKVRYLAPEQMQNELAIDRRVDVFAAGIILWELLTGTALFKGETFPDTLAAILTQHIRRPSEVAEVAKGIDDACMKALSRPRDQRWKTAGDFGDALEEAAQGILATPKVVGKFVESIVPPQLLQRDAFAPRRMASDPDVQREVALLTPPRANEAPKITLQKAPRPPLAPRPRPPAASETEIRAPAAIAAAAKPGAKPLKEDSTEIRPTPGVEDPLLKGLGPKKDASGKAPSLRPPSPPARSVPARPLKPATTGAALVDEDDPPTKALELSPAIGAPPTPSVPAAGAKPGALDTDEVPTKITPAVGPAIEAALAKAQEAKAAAAKVDEEPPAAPTLLDTPVVEAPSGAQVSNDATAVDGPPSSIGGATSRGPASTTAVMAAPDTVADEDGPTRIREDGARAALAAAGIAAPTPLVPQPTPAAWTGPGSAPPPALEPSSVPPGAGGSSESTGAIEIVPADAGDPRRKARVKMIAFGALGLAGVITIVAVAMHSSTPAASTDSTSSHAATTSAPKAPEPAKTAEPTSAPLAATPTAPTAEATTAPADSATPEASASSEAAAPTETTAPVTPSTTDVPPPSTVKTSNTQHRPPPPSRPPPAGTGKPKNPPKYVP